MKPLKMTTPTSTSTRIVRSFDAPVALVWRAHTEAEIVKQWASGPADHELITCEIDFRVGGTARYVWKNPQFEMGMTAEFLEIVEPTRIVHTEDFDGWPEGRCTVTTQLVEAAGETTVTIDLQYLTQEARDAAMQPGFAEGYEASYTQLDRLIKEL
ncbi:MAG: SRPBCC domain-containing protein [Planctomycetota bacterium]